MTTTALGVQPALALDVVSPGLSTAISMLQRDLANKRAEVQVTFGGCPMRMQQGTVSRIQACAVGLYTIFISEPLLEELVSLHVILEKRATR